MKLVRSKSQISDKTLEQSIQIKAIFPFDLVITAVTIHSSVAAKAAKKL